VKGAHLINNTCTVVQQFCDSGWQVCSAQPDRPQVWYIHSCGISSPQNEGKVPLEYVNTHLYIIVLIYLIYSVHSHSSLQTQPSHTIKTYLGQLDLQAIFEAGFANTEDEGQESFIQTALLSVIAFYTGICNGSTAASIEKYQKDGHVCHFV
jgi:hypothetical protein